MDVNGVISIFNIDENIVYIKRDKIIYKGKEINIRVDCDFGTNFTNNKIFLNAVDGSIYYVNLEKDILVKANGFSKNMKFPLNEQYFYEPLYDGNLLLKFYDFNNKLIQEWTNPNSWRAIPFNSIIIILSEENDLISIYQFLENKIIWTYSIKELGIYTDFTGTYGGKFLLPFIECQGVIISEITSPGLISSNVRFIGLDVANGDLLWINEFPNPYRPKIINYKNELLVLGEFYNKYDPHTGNLLGPNLPFKDTIGEYQSLLVTDEYIFSATLMIDIKQYSRKNGEILWTYSLHNGKKKGKGINSINKDNPMQYAESKLYVLDIGNVLHVLDVPNDI